MRRIFFHLLLINMLCCYRTAVAAPGDIIFQEQFNNNGDFASDWQVSGGGAVVNNQTFNSAPNALRITNGGVTVTSRPNRIDAAVGGANVAVWIRRGSDTFSEDPDTGEDLVFEYLNDSGTWIALATYAGNGTPGEIFTPTFVLPSDALYSGLRLRFRLLGGSNGFDFWHIDDVVVTETAAPICSTYLDRFSSVSYANSDGSLDWSTSPWVEQDTGGGGAGGGLASISGNRLNLMGNNTTNNTHVVRQADTSTASQLTLSLDFSTAGGIEAEDSALIEISSDGGANFTTLENITGFTGSASGSRSYDIIAYASATMQVRIAIGPDDNTTPCCYGGGGETFRVDNVRIEVCPPPVPVGEWRMEQLTWNGTADEAEDSTGNNLHGTAVAVAGQYPTTSAATPAITGDPGTCRYGVFDGTADGYIRVADNALLDIPDNLTVTAWIYPTGLPSSGNLYTIASKDENWEFHINSSNQIFWWWGGGAQQLTTTGTALTTGTWYHIAITYTSGTQRIYIDGVQRASGTATGNLTLNNDPFLIGTDLNFNSRNFDGFIDEVRVYHQSLSQTEVQTIMAETHPCTAGPVLDHFAINIGTGSASTCVAQAITITAQDSSSNKIDGYIGNITLATSTNHGRWQKTSVPADALGPLTPSGSDNGAAGYQFELAALDNGDITLELNNTHAETLTITVTDVATSTASTSAALTFSENAFVVTNTDSLLTDIVAGRNHDFHIAMVRRDTVTGVCGPATDYTVADIKAWVTRDAADPSGAAPALQTDSETQSLPDPEPALANLTLPFVNGEADFTLNTTDVGKYLLNFKDDSLSFSAASISGGSSTLIVRPFGFDVQIAGNPAAVDATGAVFTTAGSNFSATARAVAWSSGDDSNDDGIADGHDDTNPANNADLSNNSTVSSFGQESPTEAMRLSAYLIQPVGGADPGLGDGDISAADGRLLDGFSGGSDTTSLIFYDEVGIIEIEALSGDSDYLGAGAVITGRMRSVSGNVGRFKPDKFVLIENDLVGGVNVQSFISESCGSFSYLQQAFTATYYLGAVNTKGNVTTNYRAAFAKLDGADSYSFGARDTASATDLSARVVHISTVTDWEEDINGDSVFDYGYGELLSTLRVDRAASPDGAFSTVSIGVDLNETQDNTTIASADFDLDVDNNSVNDHMLIDETDTALRFGRLRLADAFGPEAAPLPVSFVTQYWNGTTFAPNTDDSCTAIAAAAITYPGGTIDTPANLTVAVGGGTTTGSYSDLSGGNVNFANGAAGHIFSAPGAGNTGSFNVDVDVSLYPWLRFDWDQDGNYSDPSLPTATYTFGSYRGHDRMIYWQEILVQ